MEWNVNNKVTIFMPVSRKDHLDRIFAALELLECNSEHTNLLVVVDGKTDLFVEARNKVEMSKFANRLCLQFKSKHILRQFDIMGRRMRISDIHNFAKEHIGECDFVFGIEDDTLVPTNALTQLLKGYSIHPFAGFIEGIEMGRWGIPYIGAWKADDIYTPTRIESTPMKEGLHEIDAGGFYCFLTRAQTYKNHDFKPFERNGLGPDVDYGLELRRLGLLNYADYSIQCAHKMKTQDITFRNTTPRLVTFIKKEDRWRQSNQA